MKYITKILKSLSDESRIRILNLLLNTEELCVCDMQKILKISQTKVSRHLSYLKNADLVQDKRIGMWVVYSISNNQDKYISKLIEDLKNIFSKIPQLQKDLIELDKAIKTGTCTTYTSISPNKKPKK